MTVKSSYRTLVHLLIAALVATACGSSAQPTRIVPKPKTNETPVTPAAPTAAAPTPPKLRLPELAHPTHYDVDLALDPSKEEFSGVVGIDLQIDKSTDVLWLNGEELTVQEAVLVLGGEKLPVKTWTAEHDFIAFLLPRAVAPGQATLNIRYTGKMHRDDGDGIYPVKEGADFYLFTQFENTDARSAFPCFDEPSYKVPWRLTLHAPAGNKLIANTQPESESKDAQGWTAVRFTETKPLPSYLIAFVVGPVDIVDAGKSRHGVPIRIVTPRGQGNLTEYPKQVTGDILAVLEDYFGSPYPYDKLDIVAVPVFNAGAMENAGLVTFRQEMVVTKAGEMTERRQQRYAVVAAHELAHQWFGDLVTLAWWDDTWLNEAFASWAEDKAIETWKPAWDLDVEAVGDKAGAMGADSLAAARRIRQPIETANDIKNAFDGITYEKGKAVLHMFETYLGEDVFQKGVRAYLAKYSWKNANYDAFIGSLSEAAGRDLKPMVSSFIEQVGVPLVSFELECKKGGVPTLRMAQKRYLPVGSNANAQVSWQVPVCVKFGAGKTVSSQCTVLAAANGELALNTKTCPDWVYPNAEGNGYYRSAPGADLAARLLKSSDKLSLRERVNLVSDLQALVSADLLPVGDALTLVARFAKDKSRHLVEQSVSIAAGINDLVPDALRANYARFIRKTYGARAKQLGFAPVAGESDDVRELRPELIALVAGAGEEPTLIAEAQKLAWKWLDEHKAVDPRMTSVVLTIAAKHGDKKLWDRFYAEAKKATDRQERSRMIEAMAAFENPEIIKANHAIVLSGEFELRDSSDLIGTGGRPRRGGSRGTGSAKVVREMAWSFVKEHFDDIVAKLPRAYGPYLAFAPLSLCSDAAKADMESFLKERISKMDGGPRVYAQALEAMTLCIEDRKAKTPGIEAFLKKQ
jgi:cytosol alanyl aminopeptidase